jgi:hypothetical protein
MARHSGRYGRVMVSTSATAAAAAAVSLNAWNIDRTTDTTETTSFGDPNKTYVQGLPDVSGSFGGFWDDTSTLIFSAANSPDGVKLYLYPDFVNNPTVYFYGPAWLDASITVGVGDAIGITANFKANGAWGNLGMSR